MNFSNYSANESQQAAWALIFYLSLDRVKEPLKSISDILQVCANFQNFPKLSDFKNYTKFTAEI